jgi:hypothetical protein
MKRAYPDARPSLFPVMPNQLRVWKYEPDYPYNDPGRMTFLVLRKLDHKDTKYGPIKGLWEILLDGYIEIVQDKYIEKWSLSILDGLSVSRYKH